jgi:hypothetical protein
VTVVAPLHPGLETSQQLHCVVVEILFALIVQPAPVKNRSLTLEDDWLVMPLPDVVETIVPVPIVPGTITPDVVAVDVPPRAGNGHVSPAVAFDATPFEVTVELIPVARPLNSCAVTIAVCE